MSSVGPLIPEPRHLLPAPPRPAVAAVNNRPIATVQWRSIARDQWIGREGRSAVGSVRRLGADYLAIDSEGGLTGFFSSLAEAESALAAPRDDRRATRTAAVVAAAAGAAAVAVAVAGLVVLSI